MSLRDLLLACCGVQAAMRTFEKVMIYGGEKLPVGVQADECTVLISPSSTALAALDSLH